MLDYKSWVGRVLNRTYQLEQLIKRGGMGAVFRARHSRLPRMFAVKIISVDTEEEPQLLERFRREAEITCTLRHPNIVEVLDYDQSEEGVPYLVMELLEGEDLARRMRRVGGPFDLQAALPIFVQAAAGLGAAHHAGVVHRDIKPSNLFLAKVRDKEVVKVVDFGVSKILGASSTLTGTEMSLGTPRYMAPEQVRKASTVDQRADIFALGAIFYSLLSGKAPFEGESLAQVIFAVVNDDPDPLHIVRPGLPPAVYAAIEAMLHKDPRQRPESMAAALEMLNDSLASQRAAELRGTQAPFASAATLVGDEEALVEQASAPQMVPTTAEPAATPQMVPTTAEPAATPQMVPTTAEPAATPQMVPTTAEPDTTPRMVPTAEPDTTPRMVPTTAEVAPLPDSTMAETCADPTTEEPFSNLTTAEVLPYDTQERGSTLSGSAGQVTSPAPRQRPLWPWIVLTVAAGAALVAVIVLLVGRPTTKDPPPTDPVVAAGPAIGGTEPPPVAAPLRAPNAKDAQQASPRGSVDAAVEQVATAVESDASPDQTEKPRPKTRPPRVIRRPRGRGTIRVVTTAGGGIAWAEVHVDGRLRGRSPLSVTLSSGPHRIEVKRDGYRAVRRRVVVRRGKIAPVRVRLVKQ